MTPTGRVFRGLRGGLLAPVLVVLWVFAVHGATTQRQNPGSGENGSRRVDLPASGDVRVENGRGGVEIEVWDENYVAVAASVKGRNQPRRSPLQIEKSDRLLGINVARATVANAPAVDVRLRVPRRARLKVFTTGGVIDVRGVPALLSAQTVSGEIRLGLPPSVDADITAHSLRGTVTLRDGFDSNGGSGRVLRQKFQTRLGTGAGAVSLFSGRGEITLQAARASQEGVAAVERIGDGDESGAREADPSSSSLLARQTPPQALPPVLGVAEGRVVNDPAGVPARQDSGAPEEVDDEVVRVDTRLVTLNVSVVNRTSGRGFAGLTQDDFRLFEDDTEQQIAQFEAAAAPFDLLLLIDLSGSTAKVTDLIRAAALRFVNATRPQDRVGVVTFAGGTGIVSPLTIDRRALREKISVMERPNGDTRLYDAVEFAMGQFGGETSASRRRAIVLMSDGMDSTLPNVTGTGSTLPYEELRDRVQEYDGVFYALWVNTEHYEALSPLDIQPETFDLAHDRLLQLSEAGGGVFYEVERLEDLAGAYERVVEDLGTVYSISYQPTNKQRDGTWRNIRVRLPRHPAAVARGKRGYFAR